MKRILFSATTLALALTLSARAQVGSPLKPPAPSASPAPGLSVTGGPNAPGAKAQLKGPSLLRQLTVRLHLTAEQQAKLHPIADKFDPQLKAIQDDMMTKRAAVMDQAIEQITPLLTAEQREKASSFRERHAPTGPQAVPPAGGTTTAAAPKASPSPTPTTGFTPYAAPTPASKPSPR